MGFFFFTPGAVRFSWLVYMQIRVFLRYTRFGFILDCFCAPWFGRCAAVAVAAAAAATAGAATARGEEPNVCGVGVAGTSQEVQEAGTGRPRRPGAEGSPSNDEASSEEIELILVWL